MISAGQFEEEVMSLLVNILNERRRPPSGGWPGSGLNSKEPW